MSATEPTGQLQSRGAVHGLVSTTTAAVVQGFGQLLVLAILARYVSKTDFGLVTATLVVIGLGRQLAEALVRPALVQRHQLTPQDIGTAATLSWLFGFVAVALLWLCAGAVAQLFSEPAIVPIIKVMAIVFLLQSPLFVAEGLIQRDFGFGRLAAAEVLSFLLGYTLIGVTLALLGAGVWALVWAYVAQVLVKTVYLVWQRPDSLRLAFDLASARATLNLAGGFGSSKLLNYAALQGDYAVVAATMNAAAVGVYGRAYQIVSLPVMLMGMALDRVLFPIYARLQHDRPRAADHYRHSVALSAIVIAPLTVLFVVLAPEIVRLLLGPNWVETVIPLQILAASLLFRMGYKLNDPLTKGLGVVYRRAWRIGIYAAAVISGAYIGSAWGLAGVAIGVSVAIIINFLLVAHLALDLLNISWRDYAAMHQRGVALALAMLPLVWGGASGLRYLEAGYFTILCAVFALVAVSWLLAAVLRPDLTLGPDVRWLARLLGNALAPADMEKIRKPGREGVVVELVAVPEQYAALRDALQTQLATQDVPFNKVPMQKATRLSRLRAACKGLLRAPRMALHDVFIILAAVRQEGSNGAKRIASWLALRERLAGAHEQRKVTLVQRGMLHELLALEEQGDLNTVTQHMRPAIVSHTPDVLVVFEQGLEEVERARARAEWLREQGSGVCPSVVILVHTETSKNVTLCVQGIAAEVTAHWRKRHNKRKL